MRLPRFCLLAIGGLLALILFTSRTPSPPTAQPCSDAWFNQIERYYFSTERENGFEDPIGIDYAADNDSKWLKYIEAKAGMPHPPGETLKDTRCRLIQNHLVSRSYIINDLTG
jgi:hypothetical protein